MDSNQFDGFSRKLAGRTTRREAVRTGGLMAAVAGAFGVRSVARAQSDDDGTDCTWAFKALVLDGPNKDAAYEGTLNVTIERDGAIDDGSLATEAPKPYVVVGNTRGKAISLRVKISNSLVLALTGVGERDIKSCQGQIDGTFAGPEFGDIGVWQILRKTRNTSGNDDASPTPKAAKTATAVTGNPGNPGSTPTKAPSKPEATSTACPPQDCGLVKTWDANQCKCVCYQGGVDCGPDLCCPTGSVCDSATSCSCPAGTVLCGNACVQECTGTSYLDYNTCTCVEGCPSGQVLCNGACVSCTSDQKLNANTCLCEDICPSGQKLCGGVCKDVINSINNCGSCGNVCPAGMPCIAGSCICPATMKYCASKSMCIDQNAVC